jgi:ABC-2 type transport system permease protein
MKHLPAMLRHELRSLLFAPSTYVAGVLFLLLMGTIYHGIIKDYTVREHTVGPAELFFQSFALPVLFMVPLLTMRAVADERRLRTLETLLSTPVTATEVVFAKFIAAWAYYCALWLATAAFPILVAYVTTQDEVARVIIDVPSYVGGYLFVCLSGLLFVAVGIFASSLTRTQLVAGMLCFGILFILLLGPHLIGSSEIGPWAQWVHEPLRYLDTAGHRADFSRGVIDTRPLFYYLTNSALVLGLAALVVESKA